MRDYRRVSSGWNWSSLGGVLWFFVERELFIKVSHLMTPSAMKRDPFIIQELYPAVFSSLKGNLLLQSFTSV